MVSHIACGCNPSKPRKGVDQGLGLDKVFCKGIYNQIVRDTTQQGKLATLIVNKKNTSPSYWTVKAPKDGKQPLLPASLPQK
jgi:hypothetical protein